MIESLVLLAAGSVFTITGVVVGSLIAHRLSYERWESEIRRKEVEHWDDFANRWYSVQFDASQLRTPIAVDSIPSSVDELQLSHFAAITNLNRELAGLKSMIRRAPEPLTAHFRLFNDRIYKASQEVPFDNELAKFAMAQFRADLAEYVRKGRVSTPKLLPNESTHEYV